MEKKMDEQERICYVDATPDLAYPIRILEAYRERCNYKWSMTSATIKEDDLIKQLNDFQDQRAEILDKAIAILYEWLVKKKDYSV